APQFYFPKKQFKSFKRYYAPYSIKAKWFWFLFSNISLVRYCFKIKENKIPLPINTIKEIIDIENANYFFNLGTQGEEQKAQAKYLEAEEVYRNIRKCYEAAGTSDVAGYFFYNEMVVKRKQMPKMSFRRAWSKLIDVLCGYGEIPYRIIGSSIAYILFNALLFDFLGLYHNNDILTFDQTLGITDNLRYFGYAIYFSIVTFTTLGYGDFAPAGWARPFAAIEGFVGAFMIALFILSFVKKMTR
ncbi:MAG: potassium channel family protein, partial [Candidatus Latescibacterota bacterium]